MIIALLASLRPKQWTKNLLVFAGYLFTLEQAHPAYTWLRVLSAFGLFCAASGAGYIFNDILDAQRDRLHPRKCKRPIACGRLSASVAAAAASAILAASIAGAFALSSAFGVLLLGYVAITALYSLRLKHIVIVDVLAIAAGFVVRAAAGAVAISVEISPWLLLCTTLLALFLGLAKRRAEIVRLEDGAVDHRRTLGEYSEMMLDQMLTIAASACLMAYFLYTFTPGSKTGEHHPLMMLTIPFVVYGLFRYLYLIHTKNAGGSPEQLLIDDKPLLFNVVLYVITAAIALKY